MRPEDAVDSLRRRDPLARRRDTFEQGLTRSRCKLTEPRRATIGGGRVKSDPAAPRYLTSMTTRLKTP